MVKRPCFADNMDEVQPFIEECLPRLKLHFAYLWMNYQARKRKYFKKNQIRMSAEMMRKTKRDIESQLLEEKVKWAKNLLRKLKKDIKDESRAEFIKAVKGDTNTECVISNPDQKGKMRRIDCLRQADKVWRLDLVIMVLFHAAPLESTDGERLSRIPLCSNKTLCVNLTHLGLVAKGLDIYLSNNLYRQDTESTPNILLTGIFLKDQHRPSQKENAANNYYPSLGVFHKELPPVTIRINDRPHPYASPDHHPRTESICDVNNNEDKSTNSKDESKPSHDAVYNQYCNDTFVSQRAAAISYPILHKESSLGDNKSPMDIGEFFDEQKPFNYTNDSRARVSMKAARHYSPSFSNSIGVDLEQSMTFSYPQSGLSRQQNNMSGDMRSNYQQHCISNYQPVLSGYPPPPLYNQSMDFNSSCGSEISTASMTSYQSDTTLTNPGYQQALEYYYDNSRSYLNNQLVMNQVGILNGKPVSYANMNMYNPT